MRRGVKIWAWLIYLCFLLGMMEASAYLVGRLRPDLFSQWDRFLAELNKNGTRYETFVASGRYSPLTGWQTAPNTEQQELNCLNEPFSASFLGDGRRKSLADEAAAKPRVALFGDSFIEGGELSDADTISSQLFRTFSIPAINYGVGGFGPTQALLRIKEKVSSGDEVEAVVFGIMFENVRRMVNRFRPVYFGNAASAFGFAPFMSGRKIVVAQELKDHHDYLRNAESAFRDDYWSRPALRFPYSVSLVRAVFTEPFKRTRHNKLRGANGWSYAYDYSDVELTENLSFLIESFDAWSRETGKRGLVLFIPQNREDLSSPETLIKGLAQKVAVELAIVRGSEDEWLRYNLNSYCHPSAFGAGMIARAIARWYTQR